MEQESKRRPGRPATGVTTKRNVRIGAVWTEGEQLAARLGMKMTAYVEEALRRENARVGRSLGREFRLSQLDEERESGRSAPTD